jgi:hypothetical protein
LRSHFGAGKILDRRAGDSKTESHKMRLGLGVLVLGATVLGLAALLSAGPAWALDPPPTREVANECRVLAYKEFPYERPGKSKGSGARYQFYRDCVVKRSNPEQPQPPQTPKAQ